MTLIPDTDHVVRLIKTGNLIPGGVDGRAFRLKEKDRQSGCSVNWIEFFKTTPQKAIGQIWTVKKHNMDIVPNHRLAELHIATTKTDVRKQRRDLTFRHTPYAPGTDEASKIPDPSHASIEGFSPEDIIIADMIGLSVQTVHDQT